ncbi:MAG: serine hydrolase [Saprospiraceae bacterium]|nr:serine hydrolase [Saprospiraceae bacterium]
MKNRLAILTLLCLCMTFIASGQNYVDSLTIELDSHYIKSDLPGFAVALVDQDRVIYEHGFGFADRLTKAPFTPETILNVGSVSKTIVGVALVKAIEDGSLTMDTEINSLLPFTIVNPYHKDVPILVRHLCSHSSTLLDTRHYRNTYIAPVENQYLSEGISQDFANFINGHPKMPMIDFLEHIYSEEGKWYRSRNFLKEKPGAVFHYSNLNAALAAYLIQTAAVKPFDFYTEEKILEPLGMTSSAWKTDYLDKSKFATRYFPNGDIVPDYALITYPDGGFYSCVADMAKFLVTIIKMSTGTSEYLNDKYTNILLPGDEDLDRVFWGINEDTRNVGHSGSDPGTQADLQFNLDRKIGRVILTNINAEDNKDLEEQYGDIFSILAKYEKLIIR